jgi:hypothetical protein
MGQSLGSAANPGPQAADPIPAVTREVDYIPGTPRGEFASLGHMKWWNTQRERTNRDRNEKA